MPCPARPPGHWVRPLLTVAVAGVAAAALPKSAVAQCSSTTTQIGPCNTGTNIAPGATGQTYTLTLINLLAIQEQPTVSVACSGYVVSCSVSPTFVHLPANGSGNVVVTYSVDTARRSGQFVLSGGGTSSTITVSPPAHLAHEQGALQSGSLSSNSGTPDPVVSAGDARQSRTSRVRLSRAGWGCSVDSDNRWSGR